MHIKPPPRRNGTVKRVVNDDGTTPASPADARILAARDRLPNMTLRTAASRARDELVALERYLSKRGMLDEFSLTNLWLVVGPWHGAGASCPHKVDCATNRKCNGDCASPTAHNGE